MYRDNRKRTKWMIPLVAAALILPFSTLGNAAMADEPMLVEDAESINQPGMAAAGTTTPSAIGGTQTVEENAPEEMGEGLKEDPGLDQQPDVTADGSLYPTYTEAYDRMIAIKETYPEGTPWTNYEPYGRDGKPAYTWGGGKIKGAESGVGCAAFAFLLSDAAFDKLPATAYDRGQFTFEDVKVGDILRVKGNSHFVIVLQKSTVGVIVAEGNYNKTVHWGRAMTVDEVMDADFIISRYPKDFIPSDSAEANVVVAEGDEASGLHWKLTKVGTLTISGSGDMTDYTDTDLPPWAKHNSAINTIVIGSGVTRIGNYAFYGSEALNATISGTVQTIGNNAFQNSHLISVSVSEGVKVIGNEAFRGCISLAYIDFPESISEICYGAFWSCGEIKSVRFKPGDSVVKIGDDIFSKCVKLTTVILPKKIDRISTGMFASCNNLYKLYIPEGIEEIGEHSFDACANGSIVSVSFGGTEEQWEALTTKMPALTAQLQKVKATCNIPFDDPFAKDPDEPLDFKPEDTENPGENPGETTPPEEPAPEVHEHNWAADWASDENNHWHECSTQGCPVTDNSQKDSYGAHTYGSWVTDKSAASYQSGTKHRDCTVCLYRQSGTIPATGSSSSSGSSSGGGSWSSGGGSSWSPGGGYWNPGSSYGGSNNTGNTENKDDTDKTDSTDDAADNNAGNTDSSSGESDANSNGTDNNAGSVDHTEQPENNTNDASTSVDYSKVKKQLKTEMKTQMKAEMKTQIKKEMKPQLKAEIKKLLKKQAQIKPKAKAKLKTQLKKQLKQELKAQLKATLKAQLKKEFGKQLGEQFIEEFNTQFNKQFNALYNEQFNKQFHTQYKQLTS